MKSKNRYSVSSQIWGKTSQRFIAYNAGPLWLSGLNHRLGHSACWPDGLRIRTCYPISAPCRILRVSIGWHDVMNIKCCLLVLVLVLF